MGCGVVERHLEMAQPTKKLLISFSLNGILSKSEYVTTKCFTRGRFAIVEISVEPLAQDLYVDQVNVRLQFLPEVAQVAAA